MPRQNCGAKCRASLAGKLSKGLDSRGFAMVSPWQARAASMFVRVKKIGGYEYLYLVENVREGGRHVQRVVKSLGRRDEVEASGVLDSLPPPAPRHPRRSIVLSSFYRGELAEIRRRSIGPDLVFSHLWRESGCQTV